MKLLSGFPWTIPNILSLFRIIAAPFMVMFALLRLENPFMMLFILAQVSDILDGQLARALGQESELGTLLDSYGDLGSYIAGFTGLVIFHAEVFHLPYAPWILAFAGLYLFNVILPWIKYGRLPGLHLYSSKATGYLQGSFLVVLFAYKMLPVFFYAMIIAGILSLLECIFINLLSKKPQPNAKGLYWLYKEGRLR